MIGKYSMYGRYHFIPYNKCDCLKSQFTWPNSATRWPENEKKGSSVTYQSKSLHFKSLSLFQNHFKSKLQQAVNNNHEVQAAGAISCIVNTKDVNKRRTCSRFKICQKLWIKNLYCQRIRTKIILLGSHWSKQPTL